MFYPDMCVDMMVNNPQFHKMCKCVNCDNWEVRTTNTSSSHLKPTHSQNPSILMALSPASSSISSMPKRIFPAAANYNNPSRLHSLKFQSLLITKSELKDQSPKDTKSKLQIGSPIIVVEAPKYLKTADSMPCLRANPGLVKPGDVGRWGYPPIPFSAFCFCHILPAKQLYGYFFLSNSIICDGFRFLELKMNSITYHCWA